jgi:hypothetical protein
MPYDITLCPGQNCPIKQNCSRFTDEILGRQDFLAKLPIVLLLIPVNILSVIAQMKIKSV